MFAPAPSVETGVLTGKFACLNLRGAVH